MSFLLLLLLLLYLSLLLSLEAVVEKVESSDTFLYRRNMSDDSWIQYQVVL